jgi:hypothetical protein
MSVPAVFSSVSLADQDRLRGAKVETGVAEIALDLFLPHRFSIDQSYLFGWAGLFTRAAAGAA